MSPVIPPEAPFLATMQVCARTTDLVPGRTVNRAIKLGNPSQIFRLD